MSEEMPEEIYASTEYEADGKHDRWYSFNEDGLTKYIRADLVMYRKDNPDEEPSTQIFLDILGMSQSFYRENQRLKELLKTILFYQGKDSPIGKEIIKALGEKDE